MGRPRLRLRINGTVRLLPPLPPLIGHTAAAASAASAGGATGGGGAAVTVVSVETAEGLPTTAPLHPSATDDGCFKIDFGATHFPSNEEVSSFWGRWSLDERISFSSMIPNGAEFLEFSHVSLFRIAVLSWQASPSITPQTVASSGCWKLKSGATSTRRLFGVDCGGFDDTGMIAPSPEGATTTDATDFGVRGEEEDSVVGVLGKLTGESAAATRLQEFMRRASSSLDKDVPRSSVARVVDGLSVRPLQRSVLLHDANPGSDNGNCRSSGGRSVLSSPLEPPAVVTASSCSHGDADDGSLTAIWLSALAKKESQSIGDTTRCTAPDDALLLLLAIPLTEFLNDDIEIQGIPEKDKIELGSFDSLLGLWL